MAIYIGLKLIDEIESLKTFSFFRSCGEAYGTISVDMKTGEPSLLSFEDSRAEKFAYPRACQAIKRHLDNGDLPDEFCYGA